MADTDALRRLLLRPRAELHLHLEGAVRASTLVRLARRAGSPLFPDAASLRARRPFDGLGGFLSLYRDVCRLLRTPGDFALLARDVTWRLRRERIAYAEVYVSPAIVERIGLDWPAVRDAVEGVFAAHERAGHGRVRVLLDAVRHFGPDAAHRVLDLHARHPWPRAVGFGLGGDELSLPARDFAGVYRRLPRLGLAPVVHAGEAGGPDSVADALRWLKPRRIAHGVGAAADPTLVRRLVRSGVALDVCLTSNDATGAFPLRRSPVLALLRSGVVVTLGTDDPGLFGTTLSGEYRKLARIGATPRELAGVLRAGFRAAFAPAPRHQASATGASAPARTRS
ncbi:MAG: adenosine deaminase family protein [Thermoanaerobaculia bacterium]